MLVYLVRPRVLGGGCSKWWLETLPVESRVLCCVSVPRDMSRSQWGFCLLYYLCLSRISRFFRFLPRVLGVLLRFRLVGDLM